MSPRSSRNHRRHAARAIPATLDAAALVPLGLAILFAAALALTAAMAASPAEAKAHGKITIADSRDTTRVKTITIDDEGIRIIGADKDVQIHEPPIPPGEMVLHPKSVRVIRMNGDSSRFIHIEDTSDNEIVQFFKDIHVAKGEQVGNVVALFGNVRNDGIINGDCVAVFGSIVQGDSSAILGDAVTVGGAVRETAAGAQVQGETVSIGFLPFAGFAVPSVPLLLFFGILSFLIFVALAALTGRLFPERIVRTAETISQRTFLSLVLGLLSIPLAILCGLLLLVTIIGIPLAAILPFLFVLAAFVGYTAAAYLLGSKIQGKKLDPAAPMFQPILIGTAFVTLFYVLGVPLLSIEGAGRVFGVGFLVLWCVVGTVCWMLGLGALLLSRLGQEPRPPAGASQWATSPSAPRPSSTVSAPGSPPLSGP